MPRGPSATGHGDLQERFTLISDERPTPATVVLDSLEPLTERILRLGDTGARVMIGIAGAPGAGKSTLAAALVSLLPAGEARVVPLDGFHLAASVLSGTELAGRRGSIDTFDGDGFLSLVKRLRAGATTVYAPAYRREIEDPIAASIEVRPEVRFVVLEGNYLLASQQPWVEVRRELDEIWFVDVKPSLRLNRLVSRHVEFGKTWEDARMWSHGSDEVNARMIEAHRTDADLVVNVERISMSPSAVPSRG